MNKKLGLRKTIIFRRQLRRNSTPAEKLFWSKISNRQFRGTLEGIHADEIRTNFLESLGYKVLRYGNSDVLGNIDGVFQDFESYLTSS